MHQLQDRRLNPEVALRRTRPADLAYVTALERRADNRELVGQWSDAEHLAAIAGEATREHWLVERGGRPAGYLIVFDGRKSDGGIYVKRILVDAKGTGTGGAALARFLEMAFARPGARFVWLNVRDRNVRAQALYRRLGFATFEAGALHGGELPGAGAFSMRIHAPSPQGRGGGP